MTEEEVWAKAIASAVAVLRREKARVEAIYPDYPSKKRMVGLNCVADEYELIAKEILELKMERKKQGTGIASTPASNTSHSPYHPAYGLTDDTRIRALRIAETSGVKAAAKECRVATGTIYKWRSDYATSASNT